ncbi:MAG: tRNA pseudouridine(13) synthase TruD [Planctomycetota bacterium]
MSDTNRYLWLTSEVPGIGGTARSEPGDFVVEERLRYEPSGKGTHHYLKVEKVGLSSLEAVRRLARVLDRPERDFGFAGHKDRRAVARQTFSIEHAPEAHVRGLELPGLRVLEVARHGNKLKRGHLAGNAFRLRIRGVAPEDPGRARRVLEALSRRGLPNFFGAQRFGRRGTTPELGRCLLREDFSRFLRVFTASVCERRVEELEEATPEELGLRHASGDRLLDRALLVWASGKPARAAVRGLPRRFLSLCTSALQSVVFNDLLRARLAGIDELWEGDLAYLHRSGAVFRVGDPRVESARLASFEISPSGPLPGPACALPGGRAAELEDSILAARGIRGQDFGVASVWAQKGGRRPLRVPLLMAQVREDVGAGGRRDLLLDFELPAGSYATVVLGELFKREGIAMD